MAYTPRTGPFVSNLGNFDTIAELISGHPATLYNPGTTAYAADLGLVVSNGTVWLSAGSRFKLAASAVPVLNAPTGTMANNGAITLGTALRKTYANCFLVLPAGAIAAGVPAAPTAYYAQMSSTTVGTVFNNTYTSGEPTVPASPAAFVTTGPGAFTGITGAQNGIQVTLPGNAMGPKGRVHISALFTLNNTAGTKLLVFVFGATTILSISNTANVSVWSTHEIQNCGVTNVQVTGPTSLGGPASTGGATVDAAIDTTANVTIGINFNNNTATDWGCIESFLIEVIPG